MNKARPGWKSSQSILTTSGAGTLLLVAATEDDYRVRIALFGCAAVVLAAYALSPSRTLSA